MMISSVGWYGYCSLGSADTIVKTCAGRFVSIRPTITTITIADIFFMVSILEEDIG
jgi:hypothetical protein